MAEFHTFFRHPVVQAPMAGVSLPALAAAVCEAGGLGFLTADYRPVSAMCDEIAELRKLTAEPFGVNLFVPQQVTADPAVVAVYGEQLATEAAWYQTALGEPECDTGDGYAAKLAVLLEDPVPLVSFTFGCPEPQDLTALRQAGTFTVVTVTSVAEARAAERAGADAVCVQGVEAGGHQATHRDVPDLERTGTGLLVLVTLVREAVTLPIVAAGGLMRGSQIAAVLAAGADAAQLGTAFLPCPESGAHPLHKAALANPVFSRTELTRAFSGRSARGLVNRFMREHGPYAPAAFPEVEQLTAPLRRAAAELGDSQAMALWAGQGYRLAREMPAGELVETLLVETRDALRAYGR